MRVAIAGSDPSLWTQPVDGTFQQSAVREFLRDRAILCIPRGAWERTERELAVSVLNPSAPNFMRELADLLRLAPLSERTSHPPVDALLDDLQLDNEASALGYAAVNETLQATYLSRRNALDEARTRNSVYHEMVRPFASTAQRVRILDPWASHDLSQGRDGVPWLVEQLVADGICHVEILSRRDDTYTQGVDMAALRGVWQEHARAALTLRLVMADPLGDAHDRQLRFFYPDGARMTPVVSLGRGVSVFEKPNFQTPPTINDSSGSRAAAEKREDVILRSNQRKTEIQFPEKPRLKNPVGPESTMRRGPE